MATFHVLALVFGFCALVATVLLPYAAFRERKLARHGVTTAGTITKLEEDNDGGYNAYVDYVVAGARHTLRTGNSSGYRVGEAVRVRYLESDPSEANIDGIRIYAGTIVCVALSTVFWLVTLLFVVLDRLGIDRS
jgi:hypothetical protein